jgi:hypothetical protein
MDRLNSKGWPHCAQRDRQSIRIAGFPSLRMQGSVPSGQ